MRSVKYHNKCDKNYARSTRARRAGDTIQGEKNRLEMILVSTYTIVVGCASDTGLKLVDISQLGGC